MNTPTPPVRPEMEALAGCPFCGSTTKPSIVEFDGEPYVPGYEIRCDASGIDGLHERGCGAASGWGETIPEAIAAWNRRASAPEQAVKGLRMKPNETSALRRSLARLLLEFDFLVEDGTLPDIRNDVIFVAAREALSLKENIPEPVASRVGCNHDILHDALQREVARALQPHPGTGESDG